MRCVVLCALAFATFQSLATNLVINNGSEPPIQFSYQELTTKLPASSFSTHLPWYSEPHKFTGFKVSELLQLLNIDDAQSVTFVALNDYASSTGIEDIIEFQPIVAYHVDGKKIKVRNKGPYWLVFNLDDNPQIDTAIYQAQMVWQIKEITIHRHSDAN